MDAFAPSTDLLTQFEIEHYIQDIKVIDIHEYGSKEYLHNNIKLYIYFFRWFKQDEIMQKLNMQAFIIFNVIFIFK